MTSSFKVLGAVLFALLSVDHHAAAYQVCPIQRVSVTAGGAEVFSQSGNASVSANGRVVVFRSEASLVPVDTNGNVPDIYAVDLATGAVELISISTSGGAANALCHAYPDVSSDGRYVSFSSLATNLVSGLLSDTHAFVRDRTTNTTSVVSVKSSGAVVADMGYTCISDDGRFVTFSSGSGYVVPYDHNNAPDVFVHDRATGQTELISKSTNGTTGNGWSGGFAPTDISADGRFVVFFSAAYDLVFGDTNATPDVFLRDRTTAQTELVSVSSLGIQADATSDWPRVSGNGRFVVFNSIATNLVPGDTNQSWDVFLRDRWNATTTRISRDLNGQDSNGNSAYGEISRDGRFIAYVSWANNVVAGDANSASDVFCLDQLTGRTERISRSTAGVESDGDSGSPGISGDGGTIVFGSIGTNLVAGDTNGVWDVFVRRCPLPTSYCVAKVNSAGCSPTIDTVGIPLASWPTGFITGARQVLNQKSGMLIYSTSGPSNAPFQGGTLCVQPPLRRTPIQSSSGATSGSDCSGSFAMDFNAWIASGVDPALIAATSVWAQYWSRDPGFPPPNSASLSDATSFVIWP